MGGVVVGGTVVSGGTVVGGTVSGAVVGGTVVSLGGAVVTDGAATAVLGMVVLVIPAVLLGVLSPAVASLRSMKISSAVTVISIMPDRIRRISCFVSFIMSLSGGPRTDFRSLFFYWNRVIS